MSLAPSGSSILHSTLDLGGSSDLLRLESRADRVTAPSLGRKIISGDDQCKVGKSESLSGAAFVSVSVGFQERHS